MEHARHLELPFFDLEHREFADSVRTWCQQEYASDDYEVSVATCRRLVRHLGQCGWFQAILPLMNEPGRMDVRKACILRQALAERHGLADFVFSHQMAATAAIYLYGGEEHRRLWLPRLLSGQFVATLAWAEPEGDGEIRCRALREGAHWSLQGNKTWVAMGELADVIVVVAREPDFDRVSAFILAGDAPGLVVTERLQTVDTHPICGIRLDQVQVAQPSLLGEAGKGAEIAERGLGIFASAEGAACVGLARRGLQSVTASAEGREWAPVNWSEEASLYLDALELMVYRAAWHQDKGAEDGELESRRIATYVLHETHRLLEEWIRLGVREGLLASSPVERIARQVRATRFFSLAIGRKFAR